MKVFLAAIFLGCTAAYAQDPGMIAAQQAQQQAIQANQQAIQQMQQAQQTALQANQQAMQAAQTDTGPAIGFTRQPVFSVKSGSVKPGTTVRIKCPTHYATIYFTTNGWTPTTHSRRYVGPIAIKTTMQLQAIAIAPNMGRSLVTRADYSVQGSAAGIVPLALPANGSLAAGTRLHLATSAAANSKTAQIGDPIGIVLDQDITVGGAILVPKGTPVQATITLADPAGHAGMPGDLAFEVHSFTAHGTVVLLNGGETLEGENHYSRVKGLIFIPAAGAAALAIHGEEAEIQPGMTFTAAVAKDTQLRP